MSNLSIFEKMKFEELFNMGTGYVLDFSNASFKRFIADTVGVDIEQEKYNYGSNSKANRLRAFWDRESDSVVGNLLSKLLEYWKTQKLIDKQEVSKAEQALFDECTVVAERLMNDDDKSGIKILGEVLGNAKDVVTNSYYISPRDFAREKVLKKFLFHTEEMIAQT